MFRCIESLHILLIYSMCFSFVFFVYLYGDHRTLHVLTHSFPTRRSSDLKSWPPTPHDPNSSETRPCSPTGTPIPTHSTPHASAQPTAPQATSRSEEHTSEPQSLMRIQYAVSCLTKKNTATYTIIINICALVHSIKLT